MPQSAFSNMSTAGLPGVSTPDVLKQTPQQLDPNYNSYLESIERAKALEEQAKALRESKLTQKSTLIQDKLAAKQKSTLGQLPQQEETNWAQNTLAAVGAGGLASFSKLAELGAEGVESLGEATGLESVEKFGRDTQNEQIDWRKNNRWNELFGYDAKPVEELGKTFQERMDKGEYLDAVVGLVKPEAITALANSSVEMGLLINPVTFTGMVGANINKNLNDLGPDASREEKAVSTGLSIAATLLDKLGAHTVFAPGSKIAKNLINAIPPEARRAVNETFGDRLAKHGIRLASFPAKAGTEGLTEGTQTILEGKASDSEKMNFDITEEERVEALQAAGVGTAAGGVPSAPGAAISATALTTAPLNAYGSRVAARKKEKKNLDAAMSYVKSGYANDADKAKHTSNLEKDIDLQQTTMNNLKETEAKVAEAYKSDKDVIEKMEEVQNAMSKEQRPDNAQDIAILSLAEQEYKDAYDAIPAELRKVVDSEQKTLGEDLSAISRFKMLYNAALEANSVSPLAQEVKDTLMEAKKSIEAQASEFAKAPAPTYKTSYKQLQKENELTTKVYNEVQKATSPKSLDGVDTNKLKTLKKDKQKEELAKLDQKGLGSIIRSSKKEARREAAIKREAATGVVGSISSALGSALKTSPTQQLQKTAEQLVRERKAAKAKYAPKRSLPELFQQEVVDKFKDITKAAEAKKGTIKKSDFAQSAKATIEAVNNLDQVVNLPVLEEAITKLESIGTLTKTKAEALRKKVKEYTEDVDVDVDALRTAFKNKFKNITEKAKTATKEDVEKEFDKFLDSSKEKLTDGERLVLAKSIAKMEQLGNLGKEKATALLDKLDVKGKEGLKTSIKNAYDSTKKTLSKEGREEVQKKAAKKVDEIKEKPLVKEMSKDIKALFDKALKKGNSLDVKKMYKKLRKNIDDIDGLEVYNSLKEIGKVKKDGNNVKIVDKVLDADGKPLIKEEVC